jgi:hypothetical protein
MSAKKTKARRPTKAPTTKRRIRRPEYVDIPIEGRGEQLVGWLRVEAHRIMWGDKATKKWRRVPLDRFIAWINDPKQSHSELIEK